jgi:rhomboid protease GluP
MTLVAQLVEVYRASGLLACQQRAFVLHAVGISYEIVDLPEAFALCVPTVQSAAAREHLAKYEAEQQPIPAGKSWPDALPMSWLAPVLYGVVLLIVALLAKQASVSRDWYDAGILLPIGHDRFSFWRAITALTLHVDPAHLLGNIGFGALFSWMAARLLGPGFTALLVTVAAIGGNVLDSLIMPADHSAVGASTWVFAALGVVSAYSWRLQLHTRRSRFYSWAHRWGALVVGVAFLGLLGAGGANTDVVAHLAGFTCGIFLGITASLIPAPLIGSTTAQKFLGIAPIVLVATAWLVALH